MRVAPGRNNLSIRLEREMLTAGRLYFTRKLPKLKLFYCRNQHVLLTLRLSRNEDSHCNLFRNIIERFTRKKRRMRGKDEYLSKIGRKGDHIIV
jgi:hypothetical protein